jgi:hypothetical protein
MLERTYTWPTLVCWEIWSFTSVAALLHSSRCAYALAVLNRHGQIERFLVRLRAYPKTRKIGSAGASPSRGRAEARPSERTAAGKRRGRDTFGKLSAGSARPSRGFGIGSRLLDFPVQQSLLSLLCPLWMTMSFFTLRDSSTLRFTRIILPGHYSSE